MPIKKMNQDELNQVLQEITDKMHKSNCSEISLNAFKRSFSKLTEGQTGLITENEITPISELPELNSLDDYHSQGMDVLPQTIVIKLNGGLGTSMGLDKAKSLLPVKNGFSFLEIVAHQIIRLREKSKLNIPLLLMNSFRTEADSSRLLRTIENIDIGQNGIPFSFIQNQIPKIKQSNLHPIDFPENQELEWCPPGHGDVYTCLNASGLLSTLLSKGYKYAFISNIDNLGAEFDPRIAGFIANKKISFLMEVAKRNMSDKKGGHLAKSKDGKILLRERAQCPENELQYFEDTDKYSYFNTNSIWINLEDLKTSLDKNGGFLDLPLIVNSKTVDPSIPSSETIFQLETAMGAAISAFDNAMAIHVPRSRFAPVKTTNDLLELWSSNFELNSEYSIVRKSTRPPVNVILDPNYYQNIEDFQRRFPIEVPNIENCVQLEVVGNVVFPKDLILEGVVKIVNNSNDEKQIKGNQTLSGEIVL